MDCASPSKGPAADRVATAVLGRAGVGIRRPRRVDTTGAWWRGTQLFTTDSALALALLHVLGERPGEFLPGREIWCPIPPPIAIPIVLIPHCPTASLSI